MIIAAWSRCAGVSSSQLPMITRDCAGA